MHAEIAEELAEAAERIALRRELARRLKEAKEAAAAPFGDPELLDEDGKRRLKAAKAKASRKAKARVPGRARARGAAAACSRPAHRRAGLGQVARRRQGAGRAQGRQRAGAGADPEEGRGGRGRDRAADQAQDRCRRARLHVREGMAGRLAPPPEGERHLRGRHRLQPRPVRADVLAAEGADRRRPEGRVHDPRHLLRHVPDAARLPLPRPARHHQASRRPAHRGRRP